MAEYKYELNNEITIIYKDGKQRKELFSYASYEGGMGILSQGDKFINLHGKHGTPFAIINMNNVQEVIMTDNGIKRSLVLKVKQPVSKTGLLGSTPNKATT